MACGDEKGDAHLRKANRGRSGQSGERSGDGVSAQGDSEARTGLALLHGSVIFLLITQAISSYTLYSYIAAVDQRLTPAVVAPPPPRSSQPLVGSSPNAHLDTAPEPTLQPPPFLQPPPDSQSSGRAIIRRRRDLDSNAVSSGIQRSTAENNLDKGTAFFLAQSKIPVGVLQNVCRESCAKGDIGPRGEIGPRGDTGQTGSSGTPGPRGEKGERGERGYPGPKGDTGATGLDGRDGIPGEPGLDGVPGRNGLDGVPGKDGTPGRHGNAGAPGRNGTDGRPGLPGSTGPQGPKGNQGLPGPRGSPGNPGVDGVPGIPGIQAYNFSVPGTSSGQLLIPPSITGSQPVLPRNRTIVVEEGLHVRLRCSATGHPRPDVEWRKLDGSVISLGSWQVTSVYGYTLNLTQITRYNMGFYTCIANNGIPPSANQTFKIEVHFRPLIIVEEQAVCTPNGTTVTLQCDVEAYPDAVSYWKGPDSRLLEHTDKYYINTTDISGYKFAMKLRINISSQADFGTYFCIAKNEKGSARGNVTIYEIHPRQALPSAAADAVAASARGPSLFGTRPPKPVGLEDLCPAPVVCQDMHKMKCREGSYALTLNLRTLPFGNITYSGMTNRTHDCQLYAVGKPVYHRFTEAMFGAWMRDSHPPTEEAADRYWVTTENDTAHLYEYANKTAYRNNAHTKIYNLPVPFWGNGHVVYNGSFYYAERSRASVIRFQLSSGRHDSMLVPMANGTGKTPLLYATGYNLFDFSVDDNGLWLIYALYPSNNTVVMKFDATSFRIQYMRNISLDHHRVGEMFIVCGVLYAVDSVEDRDTSIRFALDLYKDDVLEVNVPFTNPFRKTTMLGYSHRFSELYTWDRGNQLTYPIRYHDIGYPTPKEDKGDSGPN